MVEQTIWGTVYSKVNTGSMGYYPRPQGNLPMFEWGLTSDAQNSLAKYYNDVAFSGFKN